VDSTEPRPQVRLEALERSGGPPVETSAEPQEAPIVPEIPRGPQSRPAISSPVWPPMGDPWELGQTGSGVMVHGERVAVHSHERGQLVYAASGVLTVTTVGGTWIAPANRVVWTPAGFEHHHRVYGATDVRLVFVPAALTAALPSRPTVVATSRLLREVLLTLTGTHAHRPEAVDRLIHVAVDELADAPEEPFHLPEPNDDRLRAVTDLLHVDPGRSSTLAELGQAVGAGERTLSRLFHTELGMSFQQWRTQLRIQHALVYLVDGHSITDTATSCGWSSASTFIEAFSATLGQTPGRYQSELRKNDPLHDER
jgi:AraC-like DNA-binding protein